ncbi:CPBP family glutamic-type intramembrane protease [Egicoccus halophilus]|nr:CPBP family glutamic-type intramembrane protease [Egicoccus halophilus]
MPPAEPLAVDVAFDLDEATCLRAVAYVRRRLPETRWQLAGVSALTSLLTVLGVHLVVPPGPWSLALAAVGAVVGWWSAIANAQAATRRALRATPGALGPRVVRLERDALAVVTPAASSRLAWGGVHDVVDTGATILVLTGPLAVVPVPRAAFPDAAVADDFLRRARSAVAGAAGDAATLPAASASSSASWDLPPVSFGARRALVAVVLALVLELVLAEGGYRIGELVGDLWWALGGLATALGAVRLATNRRLREAVAIVWGARPTWRHVGLGVGLGALLWFVDQALATVVGGLWPATLGSSQAWLEDAMTFAPLVTTLAVVVTGPIVEELLFRGVLLRGLRRRWGVIWAVLLSSLAFAAVHPSDLSPPTLLLLLSTFAAGILFAVATIRTGTLTVAVVAHMVANLAVTLLGFLPGPAWIVEVGPDAPVTAFELAVGDCAPGLPDEADDPAWPQRWGAAEQVDCERPHDLEVYLREPLEPQDDAAGVDPDEVDTRCYDAFAPYVGRDWETSALDYLVLVPNATAYASGQRELVCVLHEVERDPLEGSMRGSGR